MRYLDLKEVHCIQHLDKSASKWITVFRNSPEIPITKDCVLHMKGKDTNVKYGLITKGCVTGFEDLHPPVNLDQTTSPGKRKLHPILIDLTVSPDEPVLKRSRSYDNRLSSPTRKGGNGDVNIGSIPARLNKFPPYSIEELDNRLQWIADNEQFGTLEKRFTMVFSCKYPGSNYYNHRNLWRTLKERGVIEALNGKDPWMPVYSANSRKGEAYPQEASKIRPASDEGEVVNVRRTSPEI